jgi:apolipoprotein N-acyltransferase
MLPGVGLEENSVQAMSAWGSEFGTHFRTFASQLRELGGVPLLLGGTGYEGLGEGAEGQLKFDARFNSVYLVDRALPDARYDKVHLTPFGERMPIISDFPWLEEMLLNIGANGMTFDLERGASADPLELRFNREGRDEVVRFGTPVCFEDTVSRVCRKMVWNNGRKDALLLINLSNDGWFGSSVMGRRMHLQASRFRSIENRVDLLRCVNTGYSAWVDSSGRIRAEAGPRVEATILAQPSLDGGWTVFAAIGQWPSVIVTLIFVMMFLLSLFHPSS